MPHVSFDCAWQGYKNAAVKRAQGYRTAGLQGCRTAEYRATGPRGRRDAAMQGGRGIGPQGFQDCRGIGLQGHGGIGPQGCRGMCRAATAAGPQGYRAAVGLQGDM